MTNGKSEQQIGLTPKVAWLAFYLGLASASSLAVSVLLGIFVESIGMIGLFRTLVALPALAAIVLGFVARNKIKAEKLAGYRKATTGLVLGTVVLIIVIVFMIAVAVFSLLMLFGQTL